MKGIFKKPQNEFFEKLREASVLLEEFGFLLIGGTCLSLQIQHRISEDFDFTTSQTFESPIFLDRVQMHLENLKVIQMEKNTLDFTWRGVKASFFGGIQWPLLRPPISFRNLWLVSIQDVLAMKIATILKRSTLRDYFDIAYVLKYGDLSLKDMIDGFYAKYGRSGKQFPPEFILKSLSYMEDVQITPLYILKHKAFWSRGNLKSVISDVITQAIRQYL